MPEHKCVHVLIEGRVQGVWFRGWTREQAQILGLDGWVRNCRDGSVEAVISGPAGDVEAMLSLCRKGPPMAHVTGMVIRDETAFPPPGFHQKSTA